ncbi:MAG: UPF0158 family protein [Candidatus Obscuribacterales bacterium]|nr:UPF0158 family protein [Candidatus Obscuribacterales bacterium]
MSVHKLDIDIAELSFAFEDPSSDSHYYLDLETGSLILIRPDLDDLSELREQVETENNRYLYVPKPAPNQVDLDLTDFLMAISDEKLKSLLPVAMEARDKFAACRALLGQFPGQSEKWQEWRKQGARQRALRWLEAQGIAITKCR